MTGTAGILEPVSLPPTILYITQITGGREWGAFYKNNIGAEGTHVDLANFIIFINFYEEYLKHWELLCCKLACVPLYSVKTEERNDQLTKEERRFRKRRV